MEDNHPPIPLPPENETFSDPVEKKDEFLSAPKETKPPQDRKLLLGIILGVFLVLVVKLSTQALSQLRKPDKIPIVPTATPKPTDKFLPIITPSRITPTPTASPEAIKINPGAIEWLSFPKVTKLDIFNDWPSQEVITNDTKYHHVANFADSSRLINVYVPYEGMGVHHDLYRLVELPSKKLVFLNKHSSINQGDLKEEIKTTDYLIKDLDYSSEMALLRGKFKRGRQETEISMAQIKKPNLVEKVDDKPFYVAYNRDGNKGTGFFTNEYSPEMGDLQSRFFYLKLKDNTVVSYSFDYDFIADDQVPKLKWAGDKENRSAFDMGTGGGKCGAAGGETIREPSDLVKDLVVTGTVETQYSNKNVYHIANPDNFITRKIFKDYQTGREPSATFENFAKFKDVYFIWKDDLGDWTVFTNKDYLPMAECAKPVIYLYPEKETLVSVKVGAEITQSDPPYGQGWQVLAQPSGELTFQGQKFPYLFWDGLGKGAYPNRENTGTVIAQNKLIKTIKEQLKSQGINQRESEDFLEFWTDKLPQTPFVRLTWLNTGEMNQLAPLSISPKPQTLIRVFLEFEGLNEPKELIPQTFSSPQRKGFTLIEWGGLLIK
jgi:hypothetical protein